MSTPTEHYAIPLAQAAYDAVVNGQCWYLKPITLPMYNIHGVLINPTGDPNYYGTAGTNNPRTATYGINNQTRLIPTNQ